MENENKTACVLRGCGVLAAMGGLFLAGGAACVLAVSPSWRAWAPGIFFLLSFAGGTGGLLLYAAGTALQLLADIRHAVCGRDHGAHK